MGFWQTELTRYLAQLRAEGKLWDFADGVQRTAWDPETDEHWQRLDYLAGVEWREEFGPDIRAYRKRTFVDRALTPLHQQQDAEQRRAQWYAELDRARRGRRDLRNALRPVRRARELRVRVDRVLESVRAQLAEDERLHERYGDPKTCLCRVLPGPVFRRLEFAKAVAELQS